MDTQTENRALRDTVDRAAIDRNGDKIGKIVDVYADDDTGRPEWLAITSGIFGNKVSFAPVEGASFRDDDVVLPYDKTHVKEAPKVEADGHLSEDEEAALYAHYGLRYSQARSDSGLPDGGRQGAPDAAGVARGRPARDSSDDAMTRSEEELSVDKRRQQAGRAKLRKWVETENVQFTVPVQREVARVVTEPITDANRDRALDGPDITENEHEIVLSEEEVVVDKNVVPKERVRLEAETVTDQEQVVADLRKEHVEVEGDIDEKERSRR